MHTHAMLLKANGALFVRLPASSMVSLMLWNRLSQWALWIQRVGLWAACWQGTRAVDEWLWAVRSISRAFQLAAVLAGCIVKGLPLQAVSERHTSILTILLWHHLGGIRPENDMKLLLRFHFFIPFSAFFFYFFVKLSAVTCFHAASNGNTKNRFQDSGY